MGAASDPAKRILVVDDHPAVSQRIGELLTSALPHAEVVAASSGEEGLALVAEHPFDLVLLDLRLPGCSGIDVLKELRVSRPGLPVIIISSLPESPYSTLARRAGAYGFVTKSALAEELEPAVRMALDHCYPPLNSAEHRRSAVAASAGKPSSASKPRAAWPTPPSSRADE
jgi:DNA-binding NarL/FixJ family response regulator